MSTKRALEIFRLFFILSIFFLLVGCGGGGGGSNNGVTSEGEETNAKISSLEISPGSLTFNPNTTEYNIEVDYTAASLTLTVVLANENASLTINGAKGKSKNPCSVDLSVGSNTIEIIVTAPDGSTTKTYKIAVTRLTEESHNANLSGLVMSQGVLSPMFNPDTTNYNLEVANSVSSLTVTPTAAGVHASIKVNETSVVSGETTFDISLVEGNNTITIVVTAEDKTQKSYILQVKRLGVNEKSSNTDLAGLLVYTYEGPGSPEVYRALDPAFQSGVLEYEVAVPNSANICFIAQQPAGVNATSTFIFNGSHVRTSPGYWGIAEPLNVGYTEFAITTTAENGDTKTYTVSVLRSSVTSTKLNSISIRYYSEIDPEVSLSLTPPFKSDITSYTAMAPSGYKDPQIFIAACAVDPNAIVVLNGIPNGPDNSGHGSMGFDGPISPGCYTLTVHVIDPYCRVTGDTTYTIILTIPGT